MQLREYQNEIIKNIKESLKHGNKRIVTVSQCGSGKTVTYSSIIKSAADKGSRVLFLVHRKELVEQTKKTLLAFNVNMDLVDLYMVQTACRRLKKMKEPKIIVVDETHHICSGSYLKILDYFNNSIVLGFTATPTRLNEGGLGQVFTDMVESVSVKWLIENSYLANYKYYGVKLLNSEDIKLKRGDFDSKQVNEMMDNKNVYGDVIEHWENLAKGKKTIIYCCSISSSISTVNEFKRNGYLASHIDGSTDKKTREGIIDDFRTGKIQLLSNVDILGEGFDVPDCECVILLRPTMSLSLHIQQSMRSMRFKEGKEAIIIDHVGNAQRHGLPSMEQQWTLKTKKKKKKKGEAPITQCEECFAVFEKSNKCPYCGWVKEVKGRNGRKLVDCKLEELTEEDFKQMEHDDYKELKTFEAMCKLQKAKKYKFGWTIRKCVEQNIEVPRKYAYMAEKYFGVRI